MNNYDIDRYVAWCHQYEQMSTQQIYEKLKQRLDPEPWSEDWALILGVLEKIEE